jgi:hypothetical protein
MTYLQGKYRTCPITLTYFVVFVLQTLTVYLIRLASSVLDAAYLRVIEQVKKIHDTYRVMDFFVRYRFSSRTIFPSSI